MSLNPHVLTAIVERFGGRHEFDLRNDSIRFPLRNCDATATVVEPGEARVAMPVEVADLGLRGLSFCATVSIPIGSSVVVDLATPGMSRQSWTCRVMECRQRTMSPPYQIVANFEQV